MIESQNPFEDDPMLIGHANYSIRTSPTEGPAPTAESLGITPELRLPRPKDLEIVVDDAQVDAVLGTLLKAYENKEFPYSQDGTRLPHDERHMPKTLIRGSRDHAMIMFNVCNYMRGSIKSVDAFKRISNLYDDRPDLFQPEEAAKADQADLIQELTAHGLGFQGTISKQWITNSQRLVKRYDGDPRNIFAGIDNYEDCLARIKNTGKKQGFVGYQEKMTSMLTYYLMDEKLIKPFMFPIPVDLHVMRVSIANQMVRFPGVEPGTNVYSPELLATLRSLYFNYAVDKGVDPLRLCDAVWMLSESLCGETPGNITLEPLGRGRRNGRSTVLIPLPINTNDPAQQTAYNKSCRPCPLEETCEFNVPSKHYYVGGEVIIRGHRLRFPMNDPPLF